MGEFKELSPTETKGYGMAGLETNIVARTDKAVLIAHHDQQTWYAKKNLRHKGGRLYAPLAVIAGKRASDRQRASDLEDSETE